MIWKALHFQQMIKPSMCQLSTKLSFWCDNLQYNKENVSFVFEMLFMARHFGIPSNSHYQKIKENNLSEFVSLNSTFTSLFLSPRGIISRKKRYTSLSLPQTVIMLNHPIWGNITTLHIKAPLGPPIPNIVTFNKIFSDLTSLLPRRNNISKGNQKYNNRRLYVYNKKPVLLCVFNLFLNILLKQFRMKKTKINIEEKPKGNKFLIQYSSSYYIIKYIYYSNEWRNERRTTY